MSEGDGRFWAPPAEDRSIEPPPQQAATTMSAIGVSVNRADRW